jgi:hypothetical protein
MHERFNRLLLPERNEASFGSAGSAAVQLHEATEIPLGDVKVLFFFGSDELWWSQLPYRVAVWVCSILVVHKEVRLRSGRQEANKAPS